MAALLDVDIEEGRQTLALLETDTQYEMEQGRHSEQVAALRQQVKTLRE